MCGIAGIYSLRGKPIDRDSIKNSLACIAHRGPDDEGLFCENNISFGHRRLSIIDLSAAGHQPMYSDDARYVIVYNGEVYNFREIRIDLEKRGYGFRSNSDTEVILKAFTEWKNDCFIKFNGMFAIAIFDRQTRALVVARDRFGIKPLYFSVDNNYFIFASEIKAILITGLVSKNVNYQALSEYCWYGNPLGANTMFESICELLPGHFLKIENGQIEDDIYYNYNKIFVREEDEENAVRQIREKLDAAVHRHLISDVPVGIFLSGGIDSSAITAFASKYYGNKLQTYSVAFDFDRGINELERAAFVAKKYKTQHNELYVKADDLIPIIEELVCSHDEPFADAANIPLFLLCRAIKGHIKVVLQGDGGDEIFGGYSRYKTVQDRNKWLFPAQFASCISPSATSPRLLRLKRFLTAISEKNEAIRHALLLTMETPGIPPEDIFSEGIKNKLRESSPFNRYVDIYSSLDGISTIDKLFFADNQIILPDTFLEKVDKSTMAHGLEVRVPFLDNTLTDYVMSLPASLKVKNGEKKYLLKRSLRNIVPDSILDAPKSGFGVPYSFWLENKLNNYLSERVNDNSIAHIFDRGYINKLISQHKQGKGYSGFLLWKALQLAIWADKYEIDF